MMNQDRRLLEVQYPLITSYVEHAALFSIVGDSEDMKSWICNNYVQLCMISNDYGYNPFFFPHNNLLRCPILETKIIEYNHRNFHEIVKEYINDGYYIHTSLDEFFIQPWVYKVHYKHPAFIYGYDDKAKSIYLADFVYPKQQFNFFEVDYYNVDQAYLCDQGVQDFMSKQSLQIIGFKLKEDGNYKFCVPKLIKLLEDYRMSNNLSNIYDDSLEKGSTQNFVFGLDIYDSIAEYIDYYKKMIIRYGYIYLAFH